MGIKDLIPWNNGGREVGIHRGTDVNPFFTLHREMNRMFDDVFRGFDFAPLGSTRGLSGLGWPQIDIDETDKEVRITAELPGLDEKDVSLEIARSQNRKTRPVVLVSATMAGSNGEYRWRTSMRTRSRPRSRTAS
jgi:HSP20 family molecular chaperone IbpA